MPGVTGATSDGPVARRRGDLRTGGCLLLWPVPGPAKIKTIQLIEGWQGAWSSFSGGTPAPAGQKNGQKAPAEHLLSVRPHWDIQAPLFQLFVQIFTMILTLKIQVYFRLHFLGDSAFAGIRARLLHRGRMCCTRQGKLGLFLLKSFVRLFWPSFFAFITVCLSQAHDA